jgi:hypothetical protein
VWGGRPASNRGKGGPRNILPGRRQPSRAEAGPADGCAVAGGAAGLTLAACCISSLLFARWYISRLSSFVIRDISSASGGAGASRPAPATRSSPPTPPAFVAQVVEVQLVNQAFDGDLEFRHLMTGLEREPLRFAQKILP